MTTTPEDIPAPFQQWLQAVSDALKQRFGPRLLGRRSEGTGLLSFRLVGGQAPALWQAGASPVKYGHGLADDISFGYQPDVVELLPRLPNDFPVTWLPFFLHAALDDIVPAAYALAVLHDWPGILDFRSARARYDWLEQQGVTDQRTYVDRAVGPGGSEPLAPGRS